jgi:diguanylate cyclase (GGDEF)-like protein
MNLFINFENPSGYILKLTFSLADTQKALSAVYIPVMITVLIVIAGSIILGLLLSWALISPIKILNVATKDVANGNLDLKVHINTKDELEELSDTFNFMTVELKKMKARAENANPLTKLPGNIVIHDEVDKRLAKGEKFVLLYCDLDHFKAFNDKYGVHKGDEAIMLTADVFKEAIVKEGRSDDFIGHEGGDDFLLLTVPERFERIANHIIKEFDKKIRDLYSEEDLKRGYIEAKGRESDSILKFPIMTISMAGVGNVKMDIDSYAQLTNIAADVKKAAKRIAGSKFLMDRRGRDMGHDARNSRA